MKNIALLAAVFLSLLVSNVALADSATWKSNAASSDWTRARNWTPATVPNGPSDIATFAISTQTSVFASGDIEVDSVVFEAGGNAFTVSNSEFGELTFSGGGIVNQSGVVQNFLIGAQGSSSRLYFLNTASAGDSTNFTIQGATTEQYPLIFCQFSDSSSAGSAIFTVGGAGPPEGISAGHVWFYSGTTAATSTMTTNPAAVAGGYGGDVEFLGGTADHATLTANGASVANAGAGIIYFLGTSTAAQATLIANSGITAAGQIVFDDHSSGGTARVELFGNGTLTIAPHKDEGVEIGSIEGNGLVLLRDNPLTVGTNNLSTTFSGIIKGSSTFTKTGTGTLTLSRANIYAGNTVILDGFLRVDSKTGSGTGTGAVQVNAGTLGGAGIISGDVTVGSGNGPGAFVAPGSGNTTLTIQSAVTFKSDGTYTWRVQPGRKSDKLVANGVTIESGAQITGFGRGTLATGTVLTAISNTSANPISGTFANLPDGGTLAIGNNTLQASYEGGDGNDLTLTVVP